MRGIFKLIDWMMHLRPDLEERLGIELSQLEENLQMPYVTSIERLAKARGQVRVVLSLLAEICGSLPEEHREQISRLSSEQLDQLAKDLLRFQSLEDLQKWLDRHTGPAD